MLLINCTQWNDYTATRDPKSGLFLQLGNIVCDLKKMRLEYLLGDWGAGAGCGTKSMAAISSLGTVLALGLEPGILLVVIGLGKSTKSVFVLWRWYSFSFSEAHSCFIL